MRKVEINYSHFHGSKSKLLTDQDNGAEVACGTVSIVLYKGARSAMLPARGCSSLAVGGNISQNSGLGSVAAFTWAPSNEELVVEMGLVGLDGLSLMGG